VTPPVKIDAHQHYWRPERGDYDWMPPDDPVLARFWGPAHLTPLLTEHDVARTVLVQAAATVAETEYMLGVADATPSVAGVVGWIDFEDPGQRATLERLARHPKFLGVRPMIQDIPDDAWMLRSDVQWTFEALAELDLTFDALGFPRHLRHFHALLTRHSRLRVVVDHCMKPDIAGHAADSFADWAEGIGRIAEDTDAFCKLSGLVTEAAQGWTTEDLRPYADHVLSAFGPERVMWGSDWPVCQLRATYGAWLTAAETLTQGLPPEARAAVFGGTAARFYRLEGSAET
jgi:L-fuconolactonase